MSLNSLKKLFAGLSLLACSSVFAAPVTIDVGGIQSGGQFGDSRNTVYSYNVGAGATILSVNYSFNVTAYSPSWLSEIGFAISDSSVTEGVLFTPGFLSDFGGTASYSDNVILADEGLGFNVGADGLLRVEFYDDFNDSAVNPDSIWNFGTITITYSPDIDPPTTDVPEPATALLMGAGIMMMGYGRRRRTLQKIPTA
ncbi:PEP-CTERM sorting domain-containing protein [Massilia sp. HP4]|uniref:PEP-CTERM sorting domain-containing protein n=1 Tax=Massilia sp. HP4 TaxID=2562316 RepID=UPI0010C01C37|nr:PEP-CTERM sorting domain-containing protein [Massilia sp. HP4]